MGICIHKAVTVNKQLQYFSSLLPEKLGQRSQQYSTHTILVTLFQSKGEECHIK